MGILNVTPDSFSDGGKFYEVDDAVKHAKEMVDAGADIIDVGGESTKPGSDPVSEGEELERVLPVIEKLVELKIPISIDSYKPGVVDACLSAGASMVNDVTGLRNEEMVKVVKKHRVPVVIMHMLGDPKTMQDNPVYKDVVKEIHSFLKDRVGVAKKAGIDEVIVDPGIGFGKTVEHNLEILKRLDEFSDLGRVLVGVSRKSFIGEITNKEVDDRLAGTLGAVAVSVLNGASIVRVHDVKECREAISIVEEIKNS